MSKKPATMDDPGEVLACATARTGQLLGLSDAGMARVIGVSGRTFSRILRGERPLPPESKAGELALLLLRVYHSLDPLVGTDHRKRVAWMRSHNKALGGTPAHLVECAEGLVATLNYLDGAQARSAQVQG